MAIEGSLPGLAAHHGGEIAGYQIEIHALGSLPLRVDGEGIADEARKDVEMDVEDLLERGLSVGEEEVDAFAPQGRLADRSGQTMSDAPETHAQVEIKID
jgi:hypothetical protein